MTGSYQVRDATLRMPYQEAQTLVQALPQVSFTHVRRAQNAAADRLANQALDTQQREARQQRG